MVKLFSLLKFKLLKVLRAANVNWSRRLPFFYFLALLISIFISLLYFLFPKLVYCLNIGFESVCAPLGVYTGLVISLPGYILVGNILSNFTFGSSMPWIITLMLVLGVSTGVYFFIGKLMDKMMLKPKEDRLKILVISAFALLLLFFIYLSRI